MNLLKTLLCLSLLGAAGAARAQAPSDPTVWQCQADCFGISGDDGATLRYRGRVRTPLAYERADAFERLKDSCGWNGIAVVRKLTGTTTQTTTTNVFESDSQTTYRREWFGLRIIQSSSGSRSYQVIDHQLRGIFEVKEATPENACAPRSLYDRPAGTTSSGDPVLG